MLNKDKLQRIYLKILAPIYNFYNQYNAIKNGLIQRLPCRYCKKKFWFDIDPNDKDPFCVCHKCNKENFTDPQPIYDSAPEILTNEDL